MKVYSCNQFCGELGLLEIKLETLDPFVDWFVISESDKTHSGLDKPLYYQENKDRYKKFQHKIIYQIITDTPSTYQQLLDMKPKTDLHAKAIKNVIDADWFDKNIQSYLRDDYEKECLAIPLLDANDDDLILLGDLDEIPRPERLQKVIENFEKDEIYHFQNQMFYFYANLQKLNEQWFGTLGLSFGNFINNSFCELRTHKKGNFIDDGGWHFTYLGDVKSIQKKIESYCHQEFNTPEVINNIQTRVDNCIELGQDVLGRPSSFAIRDINDGTFPKYLVENQDKFGKYIRKPK